MNPKFKKLKDKLMELFQLDQPDLDFGLYRIMHSKGDEVSHFLEKDLLPQVKAAFSQYRTADRSEMERELTNAIQQAKGLGVDPETTQKVKDLRARLKSEAVDVDVLENEVYDHLYTFFRRYYSEGDFLARQVYKPGVYAIPYEGEEVTLHWANKDQYYIKTSEILRDYTFRLQPEDEANPMRVHFCLVDAAEGEHGNVKAVEGKERRFKLAPEPFATLEDGELVLKFTYQPDPAKQKELNTSAERDVLGLSDPALVPWVKGLGAKHQRTDGTTSDSTRLRVHLDRFTASHTFDYFIHKDLGSFLRRELDFYIKNEVMHLDDVESETAPRVEQYLSKIKVLRRIAGKIIDFLAQLEDFQKKLWLKKKFVVDTQYCITVGSVPEEFLPEIAANDAQREEWLQLYGLDKLEGDLERPWFSVPLTVEYLQAYPSLVVDTRHFDEGFKARLLEAMGDVDEHIDGMLVHSENFQALSLLGSKFRRAVKCIYIDPPYNSPSSLIPYKNDYRHSSWLSLMQDRIQLTEQFLSDGIYVIAIDENEQEFLGTALNETWLRPFERVCVSIRHNPRGIQGKNFSHTHEYAYFLYPADGTRYIGDRALETPDVRNLRDSGLESNRTDARNCFYPFYTDGKSIISIGDVPEDAFHPVAQNIQEPSGLVAVWPIDTSGREKKWRYARQTVEIILPKLQIKETRGKYEVYFAKDCGTVRTLWTEAQFDASQYGTKLLQDMFGSKDLDFSYPKSVYTLVETIRVTVASGEQRVLDFFAGSGTTGHAVINLNREDGGRRKFILVEMGDYFDTVLLPRLKKVAFTPEWKDGRPKRLATPEEAERAPRIMKVLRLESYEDTLNNLETRRTDSQRALLEEAEARGADGLREQYLLRYMLDVETRGSSSLLNLAAFADPTTYMLKVKRPGSDETREVRVDLLETFNYLVGLTIKQVSAPRCFRAAFERDAEKRLRLQGRLKQDPDGAWWFRAVEGTTPEGKRTLVIWRNLTGDPEQDNLVLDEWFRKHAYSTRDSEFDQIYVNGDNNLENLKTADEHWKVKLLEEDFHRLMFADEGRSKERC